MVAATVFVVAFADMGREGYLSRLIDITGKTSLALAFGTRYLAAPMIFFKMKSVVAGIGNLLLNETEKLNILKAANRGYTLQFLFSAVNDTFS